MLPCLALAGVVFSHRNNGGAAGVRLAERYLAVGWVVGSRVGLVTSTPVAALLIGGLTVATRCWTEGSCLPRGASSPTP